MPRRERVALVKDGHELCAIIARSVYQDERFGNSR